MRFGKAVEEVVLEHPSLASIIGFKLGLIRFHGCKLVIKKRLLLYPELCNDSLIDV